MEQRMDPRCARDDSGSDDSLIPPAMSAPCPSSTTSRAATTPTSASSNPGTSATRAPASCIAISCRRSPCGPTCSATATAAGISMPRSTRRPSARRRCAPSCSSLRERGLFGRLWREEPYKVSAHFNAPAPARDGARGGAVVRRARLRTAHDRLCEEARRAAHLGAAPLLRQADLPRRARQHRRGRPAGEHRHLREPDQGMRRGGRDPARASPSRPRPSPSSPTGINPAGSSSPTS